MAFNIQPCPDCWGEGKMRTDWRTGRCAIVCEDCGAYTVSYREEEPAIRDWNSGHVISRLNANQDNLKKSEAEFDGYEVEIGKGKKSKFVCNMWYRKERK